MYKLLGNLEGLLRLVPKVTISFVKQNKIQRRDGCEMLVSNIKKWQTRKLKTC